MTKHEQDKNQIANSKGQFIIVPAKRPDGSTDEKSTPFFFSMDVAAKEKEMIRQSVDVLVDGIMTRLNSGSGVAFFAFLPDSADLDLQLVPFPAQRNLENMNRILNNMTKEDKSCIEECIPEPERLAARLLYSRLKKKEKEKKTE